MNKSICVLVISLCVVSGCEPTAKPVSQIEGEWLVSSFEVREKGTGKVERLDSLNGSRMSFTKCGNSNVSPCAGFLQTATEKILFTYGPSTGEKEVQAVFIQGIMPGIIIPQGLPSIILTGTFEARSESRKAITLHGTVGFKKNKQFLQSHDAEIHLIK